MNGVTDVGGVPMVHTGDSGGGWIGMLLVLALLGGGMGFGHHRGGHDGGVHHDIAMHDRHMDDNFIRRDLFDIQKDVLLQGERIQNKIGESSLHTTIGFKDLQHVIDKCCCETNRNIDSVKFENERNTCKIIDNQNAIAAAQAMERKNDELRIAYARINEQNGVISENRIIAALGGRHPFFGFGGFHGGERCPA